MNNTSANAERLTAACVLSIIGGFLDIYTYLYRGKVFANAVTGNMVLCGFHLAHLEWRQSVKYLFAIFFYALGIFIAEIVHRKLPAFRKITWHQCVILLELLCLAPVCFVPYGEFDFIVNALISFVCALQVQTFRRVRGLPFASTMCTGNLRSGTEALFLGWVGRDPGEWRKALHYYGVIVCFIFGAVAGAVLLHCWGRYVFLLVPAGLCAVFGLITTRRELASWRRSFRKLRRFHA
ncbi:YoaK family protein [Victivallis sp. Marseille-Q1083]|uniref:YoaK family protein n=1 Tax=Victivallis sp. Marseille-Q1083 TaxID=2717288 RepID=UPI001589547E|nr:YoaK family protein [Victivallis sp. Marseille-Q1083]